MYSLTKAHSLIAKFSMTPCIMQAIDSEDRDDAIS